MNPSNIILIIGPTASGKSDYAQKLAVALGGEIVNFDSQQFYRGLDIGTGKIPPADRQVPHWLLDILEPGQWMSAGAFARLADGCIAEIRQRKKIPILVGGTGLYARALLEGLDVLPERDPQIRAGLQKLMETEGLSELHGRLKEIDPVSADKISSRDTSRLVRFLEIFEITGKKPSELMGRGRRAQLRYPTQTHWFRPPRESLKGLIEIRVRDMIRRGWAQEVKRLIEGGCHPLAWHNKPIGYGEWAQVLGGEMDLEKAEAEIVRKTAAYAKRQETFLKKLLAAPAYQNGGSSIKTLENFFRKS